MKPTLIIDADDTLWESEIYYQQATTAFAEQMMSQGLGQAEAEEFLEMVERERVPQVGYAPQQFACSLVVAYQRLCKRYYRPFNDRVSESVRRTGLEVAEHPILLLKGVAETLAQLSGHCHLLLLTKGDQEVQESKVARSGLGHLFAGVHVVPEKNARVIQDLLTRCGLQPDQTWMVGNSPRSDINPALVAGVGAIYIPHPSTWEMEQEGIIDLERVIHLKGFGELAGLFPR